jgi:hypothetical protein
MQYTPEGVGGGLVGAERVRPSRRAARLGPPARRLAAHGRRQATSSSARPTVRGSEQTALPVRRTGRMDGRSQGPAGSHRTASGDAPNLCLARGSEHRVPPSPPATTRSRPLVGRHPGLVRRKTPAWARGRARQLEDALSRLPPTGAWRGRAKMVGNGEVLQGQEPVSAHEPFVHPRRMSRPQTRLHPAKGGCTPTRCPPTTTEARHAAQTTTLVISRRP